MKKRISLSLFVVLLIFTANTGLAQTAREIADKASDIIDFPSMEMTSTLKIYDAKGRERVRQLVTATKSLMAYQKP